MTIDWEAVSAIGQIVGAAAVVVSLIYLALQVRDEARGRRAATMHEQSQAFTNICLTVAASPDLADTLARGVADARSMTPPDKLRFALYFSGVFRGCEDCFFQHRGGHLDERIWRGMAQAVGGMLALPGIPEWWATQRAWYSAEFQAYVGAKIAELAASSPET